MATLRQRSRPALLLALLLLLLTLLAAWPVTAPRAAAQVDDLARWGRRALNKADTTTRRAKGEFGEANTRRLLGNLPDFELEARYIHGDVLDKGIDHIYRRLKNQRFNVIESKTTTSTGRLSLSMLPQRNSGRQMSESWIRSSLDQLSRQADDILADPAATHAARLSAHRTRQMIAEIKARRLSRFDRTLVITRFNGIDEALLRNGDTISQGLLDEVPNIIELSRSGRVLRVYSRGRVSPGG